ncbi:hypothetical protein TREES_T100010675 [Tupaia chinensis]|uniref:Uncharacterized protein n=1 Tax=Tupaia chinensis TaxID=246437 RepID=L9KQP1_TUPCH|nr:hypothetical protein TREES_T100010675 [Tupaia chinensis]
MTGEAGIDYEANECGPYLRGQQDHDMAAFNVCSSEANGPSARHRAVPTNGYKEDEVKAGQSHGSLSGGYAQQ